MLFNNCHDLETVRSTILYHHILSHVSCFLLQQCTGWYKIKQEDFGNKSELLFIRKCPFPKMNQVSHKCTGVWFGSFLSDFGWLLRCWCPQCGNMGAESPIQASWLTWQPGGLISNRVPVTEPLKEPEILNLQILSALTQSRVVRLWGPSLLC